MTQPPFPQLDRLLRGIAELNVVLIDHHKTPGAISH